MSKAWSFALVRLIALLLVALIIGLIVGHVQAALLVAVSGGLLLQWMQLYRLSWWLQHRSAEDAPDLGGLWGEIIALIMRIYRRKLFLVIYWYSSCKHYPLLHSHLSFQTERYCNARIGFDEMV